MSFTMGVSFGGTDDLFITELDQYALDVLNDLAMNIWYNLIAATPVDTSSALNSWDIGESNEDIKEFEYGDFEGSLTFPKLRKGAESFVIGSRSPYMQYLNEGWSSQAPALFIETATEEGVEETL